MINNNKTSDKDPKPIGVIIQTRGLCEWLL